MKKSKNIRLFDVAFKKEIMKEVIQYYVDILDKDKINQDEVTKTVEYAVQMVFGRIIFEATPRVVKSMMRDVKGFRVIIEAIGDENSRMLDIKFDENDIVKINPQEVRTEKTDKKIDKQLNELK